MQNLISALPIIIGLAAGNFIWQAVQADPNWMQALDRSFFQLVAVAATLIFMR